MNTTIYVLFFEKRYLIFNYFISISFASLAPLREFIYFYDIKFKSCIFRISCQEKNLSR